MTGEALRRKLSPMGKTAAEWAELLGVSDKTIYRMYKAQDVRTDMVERLCRALGKPLTFLYGGENDTQELTASFTGNSLCSVAQEEPPPQPSSTYETYDLELRIRTLLKKKRKKMIDLSHHIGMTEAGARRMLANHNCTNTTLIKIADFFKVPITYFLPTELRTTEEEAKVRQIYFLKGQLEVYQRTLSTLLKNDVP